MTRDDKSTILKAISMLRTLGANGFSNLQPGIRMQLRQCANELDGILKRDEEAHESMSTEDFDGEVVTA